LRNLIDQFHFLDINGPNTGVASEEDLIEDELPVSIERARKRQVKWLSPAYITPLRAYLCRMSPAVNWMAESKTILESPICCRRRLWGKCARCLTPVGLLC
jgi:hypothetical protein